MNQPTLIEMGGMACAITSNHRALGNLVHQRYQGFSYLKKPQFHIEVECVTSPQEYDSPLEILSGPVTPRFQGNWLHIDGKDFTADFDFLSGRGHIRQPLNLTPLDLLLKAVYGYRLFQMESFFVHSCAIARQGEGSIFFGPSGSGKSTIARMAQDIVLADELVIVSKDKQAKGSGHSTYSVQGTPFWRGVNFRVPLTKLFALNFNREESSLEGMVPVQALRKLLSCIGYFTPSPGQQTDLFNLAISLVRGLPCHTLTFSPQPQFWSWLDAQHN